MLLRPGTTIDEAIRLIEDIRQGGLNDVSNMVPGLGAVSFEQLATPAILAYERWTASAQKQLRTTFRDGPVIERLRGGKYWIIVGSPIVSPRAISMLNMELAELRAFFDEIANQLRLIKGKFSPTSRLVLDTNDLLHYYRLDNIPWTTIYGKGAHIMLPHVVIDEIDSKSYNAGPSIQRRARGVYRMLENLLESVDSNGQVTLKDGTLFEILVGDPEEPRLPNNDDEIVARTVALQQAIYPGVATIVTRDIGMRTRALAQRLKVSKLPDKYLIQEDNLSASAMDLALTTISFPESGRSGEVA